MPSDEGMIPLSVAELRAVARFAVECARPALPIYERARPGDRRPHAAVDAAQTFADGAERTKSIRDCAWAAHRAYQETRDTGETAASEAARAAVAAAGAVFLHPLAKATQVKHILGAAAHTARALEITTGDADAAYLAEVSELAGPTVIAVLTRYPGAPAGGGRVGELIRHLDGSLR